jgi:hypothetical protein
VSLVHFDKFHHPIPTNVGVVSFMLQQLLLELEIYILWVPVGSLCPGGCHSFQKTGSSHKMLICMQHCVEISKETLFNNFGVFIPINIGDRSVLNYPAVQNCTVMLTLAGLQISGSSPSIVGNRVVQLFCHTNTNHIYDIYDI